MRSWSKDPLLDGHLAWDACSAEHGLCLHLVQGGNALSLGEWDAKPAPASSITDQLAAVDTSHAELVRAQLHTLCALWWFRPQGLVVFRRECSPSHPEKSSLEATRGRYRHVFAEPGFVSEVFEHCSVHCT